MKEHENLKSLFQEHQDELSKLHIAYEKMREHILTFNFEEFEKIDRDINFCYNKEGKFLGINVDDPDVEYLVPTDDCCGSDLLSMYFYTIYEERSTWTGEFTEFSKEYHFSMEQAFNRMNDKKRKIIPEELRNYKPSPN